jgi:hypothetical protein
LVGDKFRGCISGGGAVRLKGHAVNVSFPGVAELTGELRDESDGGFETCQI